jgi:hypothetical protein
MKAGLEVAVDSIRSPVDYLQLITMAGGAARNPRQIVNSVYRNCWTIERRERAAVRHIFETRALIADLHNLAKHVL